MLFRRRSGFAGEPGSVRRRVVLLAVITLVVAAAVLATTQHHDAPGLVAPGPAPAAKRAGRAPLAPPARLAERRRVRVSIRRAPAGVVYAVEDDGPGVAEDERERIFEPGRRGRTAAAGDGAGGAGLGLALARRLARSAAGEVEALAGGEGGRFVVRLPAA